MVNEKMYLKYDSVIKGYDIRKAIDAARDINPNVKRIYIDVTKDGKINFIARNDVSENVVHTVENNRNDICLSTNSDASKYHGHSYCVSIKLYEEFQRDSVFSDCSLVISGNPYLKNVSCPL